MNLLHFSFKYNSVELFRACLQWSPSCASVTPSHWFQLHPVDKMSSFLSYSSVRVPLEMHTRSLFCNMYRSNTQSFCYKIRPEWSVWEFGQTKEWKLVFRVWKNDHICYLQHFNQWRSKTQGMCTFIQGLRCNHTGLHMIPADGQKAQSWMLFHWLWLHVPQRDVPHRCLGSPGW